LRTTTGASPPDRYGETVKVICSGVRVRVRGGDRQTSGRQADTAIVSDTVKREKKRLVVQRYHTLRRCKWPTHQSAGTKIVVMLGTTVMIEDITAGRPRAERCVEEDQSMISQIF
jgi:hypothetical protein